MVSPELKNKVGQLMVFGFKGKTASPEIKKLIRDHHVGGIILFGRNIGTPEEVLALTTELQREAKKAGHEKPLLICLDQENGVVRRLGEGTTVFPGAMLLGATKSPENAYAISAATAKELKALGLNWNLAPVVDVNNNPENPVIGVRSFGESPEQVSLFGQNAMQGMQDVGVITTLKHFPGHGDTNVDSHLDLPVITHEMDRLEEIELKPFKDCIDKGADVIMTAHVYFPAIEDRENVPATLSHKVINGLLREKLGFNGVVTTDCMEMNAIADNIGTAQGGVEAIKAGVDLIMVSHLHTRHFETINEILKAVNRGEIDEKTIDAAYGRVMKLKEKYLSWEDIQLEGELEVSETVGCKQHEFEAAEVYRQGVTIVKNEKELIPLSLDKEERILVVYPENNLIMQVEDRRYSSFSLEESIREFHEHTDVMKFSNPPTEEEVTHILEAAKHYSTVIVGTLTALPGSQQVRLVEVLNKLTKNLIVIATRSPYDLTYFPGISTYICTYEFTYPALRTAASAIFGKKKVSGELPVTIPNL
ncbi:beta-N-acetylhexosaminidase [Bacillus sp. 31A1R]|uniref:Beta-N-acetylhexosaminidase n=1 Tax=Robertmurraya mangrovi TaxID=3098077 RepID=A0ABU5J2R2_9BACI|nr:beta-N-acetylhexosaminidase [Bacillus sp. 31A1R]MDZ5473703.1 beta-N-acetylhexosaminidase [Bacillus sp. 31A1R]